MEQQLLDVWNKLNDLALGLGQPDIMQEMVRRNTETMLMYWSLYAQLGRVAATPQAPSPATGKPTTQGR